MNRTLDDVLAGKTIKSVVRSQSIVTIEFADGSKASFHGHGGDYDEDYISVDVSYVVTEKF